MKTKGARLTTEISLPGRFVVFVPHGEGLGVSRRLDDDERARLKDILKELDAEGGRRHRPHRRRGRVRRGHRARPRLPAAALEDDPGAGEDGEGAGARLPGGRAAAARSSRDLFTGDFERRSSTTTARYKRIVGYLKKTSPHMVERVAPLQGARRRSSRRSGVDAGDPLDAQPPRRPALGRLPDLRLRRGVHGHRRQHRPLRRLALEDLGRAARGHDHEEQPRGGQGGRAPAAAARHRRDHRHRLHRHGEPEEPGRRSRRRCAPSSSATGRRPTSSRSRRSGSSR